MELFLTISPNSAAIHNFLLYNNLLAPRTLASVRLLHLTLKPLDTHLTEEPKLNSTLNATIKLRQVNRMMKSRPSKSGWHRSPFNKEDFQVKDGRHVSITNSVFGAVYPRVDDKAYPVCDTAGYAPFGFGYRRCAGEFLTVGFFKDLLIKVWSEKIDFITTQHRPSRVVTCGNRVQLCRTTLALRVVSKAITFVKLVCV